MQHTLQHKNTSFKQHDEINTVMDQATCGRCGGLMVDIQCLDIDDPSGQLWFDAKHCVQCGNLIDPLILKNQGIVRSETQRPSRSRPSYAVSLGGGKKS